MEVISILISPILAIMFNKLKRILILYSTFPTIYVLLKIRHPEIILRPFNEWTLHNLFNGYNFWIEGFIWLLVVLLFFYLIIPKTLYLILKRLRRSVKINNPKNILETYKKPLNIGISIAKATNFKFGKQANGESEFDLDSYTDAFILFFSMSLHALTTLIYFIGGYFVFFVFGFMFVLILMYSGIPTVYAILNELIEHTKQEVQKERVK